MDQADVGSRRCRVCSGSKGAVMARWKNFFVGIITVVALLAQVEITSAQQSAAEPGQKLALDVRSLTVQIQSDATNGYGFVVGKAGDVLTIVTANHVVRNQ